MDAGVREEGRFDGVHRAARSGPAEVAVRVGEHAPLPRDLGHAPRVRDLRARRGGPLLEALVAGVLGQLKRKLACVSKSLFRKTDRTKQRRLSGGTACLRSLSLSRTYSRRYLFESGTAALLCITFAQHRWIEWCGVRVRLESKAGSRATTRALFCARTPKRIARRLADTAHTLAHPLVRTSTSDPFGQALEIALADAQTDRSVWRDHALRLHRV